MAAVCWYCGHPRHESGKCGVPSGSDSRPCGCAGSLEADEFQVAAGEPGEATESWIDTLVRIKSGRAQ